MVGFGYYGQCEGYGHHAGHENHNPQKQDKEVDKKFVEDYPRKRVKPYMTYYLSDESYT